MMPGFMPRDLSWEEQAKYCMRANRPGWADQVRKGDILVAGQNFGTGSNRPAARSLKVLGIACVVAENINSLMFRNCINWGLPALPCKGVSKLFVEGDVAEVDIRAANVKNVRTGENIYGSKIPDMLLDIVEADGVIPLLEKEGYIRKSKNELSKTLQG
jgi:3-isopropylmalate/(R)-2-methylmalate dehydratase small subunit